MTFAHRQTTNQRGFTLLEVLIVLFILGLLVAMVVPALGVLDDRERERITRERMELIRRAIIGPDDRFDAGGRPIVGGYVGDMKAWPDLWEARAEVKPEYDGAWDNPSAMGTGFGQGPDYTVDADKVFLRPSGHFVKKRWKWNLPYRKLYDDTTSNADHIGGLETENEGQPRGLWTRYPEELPWNVTTGGVTHPAPGEVLGDNWKGPYILPPIEENPADSGHWAETDAEYEKLLPVPKDTFVDTNGDGTPDTWLPSWEDGDYTNSSLGEPFDDRESSRLLQSDGRLIDGWGRALRFFITADPSHAGSTIFWILSEGPDGEGTYPNKGTCGGHAWTVDAADVMATAYDENDEKNRDNLVLKIFSRDWEAIFADEETGRTAETRTTLEAIRNALVGKSPAGFNSGLTGDVAAWPGLFRWEDNSTPADTTDDYWDNENEDSTPVAYTKGQPRGLWTRTPNSSDTSDDLEASRWGIGWRHAYLQPPVGSDGDQMLRDAWGREILFFHDAVNGLWLILSRGADGLFDFGTTNTGQTEPENFIEAVDVTTYTPTATQNADNCHIVVAASDWQPGFFKMLQMTVYNATAGTIKARFFRAAGSAVLTAATLSDADGDGAADDWVLGTGTDADPAFRFDDTTTDAVISGARYLVIWNDADGDDAIDSGESGYWVIYDVLATSGSGEVDSLTIDTADFTVMP